MKLKQIIHDSHIKSVLKSDWPRNPPQNLVIDVSFNYVWALNKTKLECAFWVSIEICMIHKNEFNFFCV